MIGNVNTPIGAANGPNKESLLEIMFEMRAIRIEAPARMATLNV